MFKRFFYRFDEIKLLESTHQGGFQGGELSRHLAASGKRASAGQ